MRLETIGRIESVVWVVGLGLVGWGIAYANEYTVASIVAIWAAFIIFMGHSVFCVVTRRLESLVLPLASGFATLHMLFAIYKAW